MVFSYYSRLSSRQQAIYRASDKIAEIPIPRPSALLPLVEALRQALIADNRRSVSLAAQSLSQALLLQLDAPALAVKVLAVRPSRRDGELHGLYTAEEQQPAEIRLWMRTARHKRVVAFRTFLRTLLHELCHHLDYHTLRLGDSYHTQGFFRRESNLFRQLVPQMPPRRPVTQAAVPPVPTPRTAPARQTGAREDGSVSAKDERQGRLRFDVSSDR
jgi:hypothetical protein